MTIIQIPQGYWNDLSGTSQAEALEAFVKADAEFLQRHPQCAKYHRPSWVVLEDVPEHKTAPWGHEWYAVVNDSLQMHSADYDSSD
jgi:hypothetical protein